MRMPTFLSARTELEQVRRGPLPACCPVCCPIRVSAQAPKVESGLDTQADARIRTADPFITSEVLYQLSYVGAAG